MLRFLTAGESHGPCLTAILEGMPAGVRIDAAKLAHEMRRRQLGYGRGPRMQFEPDAVEILGGVRKGKTIGSPIALIIRNKDTSIDKMPVVTRPRPGHADLAGAIKYATHDARDILERASARETAARVAVGALCKQFLEPLGIVLASHVIQVGPIKASVKNATVNRILEKADGTPLRCLDAKATDAMVALIEECTKKGDTLGAVFEVIVEGAPVGLGSHVHYDRRLEARLGRAVLSIQAIKAVEIGDGIEGASLHGSQVQDEISYAAGEGFKRSSNHSGGFEGGMTNGQPLIVRGYLKPLSTLKQPLRSADIVTKEPIKATVERTDVTVGPAAGIVAEAMIAFELANAMQEKFGGDSLKEIQRNLKGYLRQVERF